MAYNAVPTVATGDTWSAANHNTYIRDNFAASVPDIFTAAGDIAYATAANAAAPLAIGSSDNMLSVVSGMPAWSTGPAMVKIAGTTLSTSDATEVDITGLNQSFEHLKVIVHADINDWVYVYLNNDTGANYNRQEIIINSTTIQYAANDGGTDLFRGGLLIRNNYLAIPSYLEINIRNYSSSVYKKVALSTMAFQSGAGSISRYEWFSIWNGTSPVTSIKFIRKTAGETFGAGSMFTVYGIRG